MRHAPSRPAEKPLIPKFVGPKATIITGETKLWKATTKHDPHRVLHVATHRDMHRTGRNRRVFRGLWWNVTNGCKLNFWI
ncbi:conserved hypothetical protein [Agrobacterium genomosp. 13 str. CFBP 6927]|uniref:Uncharacterized protein n=1 Tax=Agrobacterium genomosp. 13 str. CFBP 6927 TaxID=1183428 RepID=A0ABM9VEU1_9HYPH|nr:conserved hypothetical protein [Agrobacterium genomosp. 13 str. CFBP 6927]